MDKDIELKDEERTPCEIITRVMGYHRGTEFFNKGKKSEFNERVYFTEEKAKEHLKDDEDVRGPDDAA